MALLKRRRPTRGTRKARTTDRLRQLMQLCAPALGAPRTLPAHIAALETWRAVDAWCAFLWPQEARRVHSVIATEDSEMAVAAWNERVRHVAELLAED